MQPNRETLLCRYHYDPLDRLVDCTPAVQATTRRFYLKDRLATEIQGAVQRSIMQHEDQLLAQQQRQSGVVDTRLLVTDQQRSVLNVLGATLLNPLAYAPYGHRPAENGLLSLLGFNGERPDPVTGCYLLGNGYRAFNPVLMRFNSPDSWSPFGRGGLNAYGYCVGDPVNRSDPTGHSNFIMRFGKGLANLLGLRQRRPEKTPAWTTRDLFSVDATSTTQLQTSARHSTSSGSVETALTSLTEAPARYTNPYSSSPPTSGAREIPTTNRNITDIQSTVRNLHSSARRPWQLHDKPPPYSEYAPPRYDEWLKRNSTSSTEGRRPKDIRGAPENS